MPSDEKFKWRSEYSVQIPLFDAQHKKLVGMLNDLLIAMGKKKGGALIEEIISRMAAYVEYHFQSEEKYMEKYDYPRKEEHIQAHHGFIEELHNFQAKLQETTFLMPVKVFQYLKEWLRTHIAGLDKDYTEFFKKHKVDLIKPE